MLRYIYRWRYKRAQKAESYKVPSNQKGRGNGQVNLGSYMSQPEVRGRSFDRFELPINRRRTIKVVIVILIAFLVGWVVLESIEALELLKN